MGPQFTADQWEVTEKYTHLIEHIEDEKDVGVKQKKDEYDGGYAYLAPCSNDNNRPWWDKMEEYIHSHELK